MDITYWNTIDFIDVWKVCIILDNALVLDMVFDLVLCYSINFY